MSAPIDRSRAAEPGELCIQSLPPYYRERIVISPDGHWDWTGHIGKEGYGFAYVDTKRLQAHRAIYELLVGPLPAGTIPGHDCHDRDSSCTGGRTCRHRRCVRADHLVPQTRRQNTLAGRTIPAVHAAKSHCDSGHAFTPENTYITSRGHRVCRCCRRDSQWRYKTRLKARRAAR